MKAHRTHAVAPEGHDALLARYTDMNERLVVDVNVNTKSNDYRVVRLYSQLQVTLCLIELIWDNPAHKWAMNSRGKRRS